MLLKNRERQGWFQFRFYHAGRAKVIVKPLRAAYNFSTEQPKRFRCHKKSRFSPTPLCFFLAAPRGHNGVVYGNLGRWQEAIVEYEEAFRIKPDDVMAHLTRVTIHTNSDQHQKDLTYFFEL